MRVHEGVLLVRSGGVTVLPLEGEVAASAAEDVIGETDLQQPAYSPQFAVELLILIERLSSVVELYQSDRNRFRRPEELFQD